AIVNKAQSMLDRNAQKRLNEAAAKIVRETRASISEAQEALKEQSDQQAQRLSDDISNAANNVNKKQQAALTQASERITANQSTIVRRLEQKISDLSAELLALSENQTNQIGDAVQETGQLVMKANKASADNTVKRVGDTTTAAIGKAVRGINSQSAQSQEEIESRIATTGADIGDRVDRTVARMNGASQTRLEQLARGVKENVETVIRKARDHINDNSNANSEELKDSMEGIVASIGERIKEAVAKVMARTKAETKAINDNTQAVVNKAQRITSDDIERANQTLEEVVKELGANTLDEMRKLSRQDRANLKQQLATLMASLIIELTLSTDQPAFPGALNMPGWNNPPDVAGRQTLKSSVLPGINLNAYGAGAPTAADAANLYQFVRNRARQLLSGG
ncbi:MAG TPA: hypothetical protein VEK06_04655, partial [Myxococcota bacterium]|nr:hypothetical protein [Myxococcota bacterium]